ncbi:MAG: hypothetical protein IT349_01410 [Candidatus Eisenbacteria bacterium]|nr:hypothetical protein [Candidatus Eisenbacteria bacterium]
MKFKSVLVFACVVALFVGWLARPATVRAANGAGVVLLHVEAGISPDTPPEAICDAPALSSIEGVLTRLPADGRSAVVFAYAAFAPDTVVDLRAVTFGIRHTANVKIHASGICNGGALSIPTPGWPGSGSGISYMFDPADQRPLVPLYWFVVACKGPGYFEITPNPNRHMGGNFANSATPALLQPISLYGAIGFDLEGFAPIPGTPAPRGACCLGERTCITYTKEECLYYYGDWLGSASDCERDAPCLPEADRGACCLASGCQFLTQRDCTRAEGRYLGDKLACEPGRCDGGSGSTMPESR